jgi:cytochrome c-type biogenesis protein CcmH/NrfF
VPFDALPDIRKNLRQQIFSNVSAGTNIDNVIGMYIERFYYKTGTYVNNSS